jgi:hypothetical protein
MWVEDSFLVVGRPWVCGGESLMHTSPVDSITAVTHKSLHGEAAIRAATGGRTDQVPAEFEGRMTALFGPEWEAEAIAGMLERDAPTVGNTLDH